MSRDLIWSISSREGIMGDVTTWRDKADEDLTPADVAEMRNLAEPVSARGPLPAGGLFVAPIPTFVRPVQQPAMPFVKSQPELLTA